MESYKYTKPWFLDSEAIKLLLTYVDKTKINRILEIGSYEGLSSVFFADNLLDDPESSLVCVDPFLLFDNNDHKELLQNSQEENFDYNIKTCNNSDKITVFKITSDAYFTINTKTFNLIYVDGCHEPDYITRDLENAFAILENDGVMWIDDYDGDQTRETIDLFLTKYSHYYDVIHRGYQLAIQKKNPIFKKINNEFSIQKTNEYILGFYQMLKHNSHTIFYIGNEVNPMYYDFDGYVHSFMPFSENIECNNPRQIYNSFLLSDVPISKNNVVISYAYGFQYFRSLNVPDIDLLHIDMQSFELNVLKSFEIEITNIKYILINYTGSVRDLHIIKEYLKCAGFSQFSCLTVYGAEILKTLFTPCVFLCKNIRY